MQYVSIDFETANSFKGSACSIGMARHDENGEVLDTYYHLICPHTRFFDGEMTAIHNLSPRDCIASPTFDKLEKDIREFINGDLLVAHFAMFDIGVLKGCYEAYNMTVPNYRYADSIDAARLIGRKFENYKLTTLSEALNLDYNAHVAIDDAINCGLIFAMGCKGHLSSLDELQLYFSANSKKIKQIF